MLVLCRADFVNNGIKLVDTGTFVLRFAYSQVSKVLDALALEVEDGYCVQ